jgi:hypothetical protein
VTEIVHQEAAAHHAHEKTVDHDRADAERKTRKVFILPSRLRF